MADNFRLKFEGDGLTFTTLCNAIDSMRTETFWDDASNQHRLLAQLPAYRLSKFQRALPECYALEMIGTYLLDIAKTLQWLQGEIPLGGYDIQRTADIVATLEPGTLPRNRGRMGDRHG